MAGAIVEVLSKSGVQLIWKFDKWGNYSDNFLHPLQTYMDSGRPRMSKWITVDPMSLLETGNIIVLVHHGGSNLYHEAIG
jgi:hypothetical protein